MKVIEAAGSLPGIKVDKGTKPLPFHPNELITEGLDGLGERLAEYRGLGAKFAKWRAVIDISGSLPSYGCIMTNAHVLARYAALCQSEGIVPIVEPEVLMDGDHDIDRCALITEWVLKTVFEQLFYQRIALEGIVLKPNMVVPGKKSQKRASVAEVAEKTLRVLKSCVPAAVPGIAFLSGGQSDEEATAHLDAINKMGPLPWNVFVFLRPRPAGRAAESLVRQVRECRRGAARVYPPRPHERSRHPGPMEGRPGKESGLSRHPEVPAPSARLRASSTDYGRGPRRDAADAPGLSPFEARCARSSG